MKYSIVVLPLLAFVRCHDITFGHRTDGRKVFDEKREASPAIWRQNDNVTINAPPDEVISRVVITDLREGKDGDANIVDGGVGEKFVTVTLKSPTALRGYSFQIEVFSASADNGLGERKASNSRENIGNDIPRSAGARDESSETEYPRTSRGVKGDEKTAHTPTVNPDARESSMRPEIEIPRNHQNLKKTTDTPKTFNNQQGNDTPKLIHASENVPTTSASKTTSSDAISTQSNNHDHVRAMRETSTNKPDLTSLHNNGKESPLKLESEIARVHQDIHRSTDLSIPISTNQQGNETPKTIPASVSEPTTSTSKTTSSDAISTQSNNHDHVRAMRETSTNKPDITSLHNNEKESPLKLESEIARVHQDVHRSTDLSIPISTNQQGNETPKTIPASVSEPTTSTSKTTSSDAISTHSNSHDHMRNMREISTQKPVTITTRSEFSIPRVHQDMHKTTDVPKTIFANQQNNQDRKTIPASASGPTTSTSKTTNLDATSTHSNSYIRNGREISKMKSDTTTLRSEFDIPRVHQEHKATDVPKTIFANQESNETPTNGAIPSTSKTIGSDAIKIQSNIPDYIREMRDISTVSEEASISNSHPRQQENLSNVNPTPKANKDALQDKTSKLAPSLINDQITSTSRTNNIDAITTQTNNSYHTRHSREVETTSENHKIRLDAVKLNEPNQNLFSQKTGDSFTTSKNLQTMNRSNLPSHDENSQTGQVSTSEASTLKYKFNSHPRETRQEKNDFSQTNPPETIQTKQRNNVQDHPRISVENQSTSTGNYEISPNQDSDSKRNNIPNTNNDKGGYAHLPRNLRQADEKQVLEAKSKSDDSLSVNSGPQTNPKTDNKATPRDVSNDLINQRGQNSKPIISLQ